MQCPPHCHIKGVVNRISVESERKDLNLYLPFLLLFSLAVSRLTTFRSGGNYCFFFVNRQSHIMTGHGVILPIFLFTLEEVKMHCFVKKRGIPSVSQFYKGGLTPTNIYGGKKELKIPTPFAIIILPNFFGTFKREF